MKKVTSLIENSFSLSSTTFDFNHNVNTDCTDQSTETIIEKDTVDQAKLNLGYRFPTHYGNEDYYALVVLNTMFGGDILQYYLMKYVKTKSSLFYSFAIRWKNGYLFVLSGVSVEKYDIAKLQLLKNSRSLK